MVSGSVECRAAPGLEGASVVRTVRSLEEVARHAHRSLVVSLVIKGSRRVSLAGRSLVAGPGSVMTVAPGTVHGCRAESPLDSLTLCLPADRFAQSWPHPGICLFHDPGLPLLARSAWEALDAGSGRAGGPGLDAVRSLLERLAGVPAAERLQVAARRIPAGVERARRSIDRAVGQSDAECGGEQLALVAGMSAWGLSRAFARAYGLPPHSYGTLRRVDRAKALLARGLPVAQVAAETGFADQSHFTRRFKRLVGLTPARYARAFAGPRRAGK